MQTRLIPSCNVLRREDRLKPEHINYDQWYMNSGSCAQFSFIYVCIAVVMIDPSTEEENEPQHLYVRHYYMCASCTLYIHNHLVYEFGF